MHVLEFAELEIRGGFFIAADLFASSRGGRRGVRLRHYEDVGEMGSEGGTVMVVMRAAKKDLEERLWKLAYVPVLRRLVAKNESAYQDLRPQVL